MVIGLARSNKPIITNLKNVIHLFEIGCHLIGKLAWCYAPRPRGLVHFQAMFISAGLEEYVAPHHPLKACDSVRGDRFISVPDMRPSVGVTDRGRDGKRLGHKLASNGVRPLL